MANEEMRKGLKRLQDSFVEMEGKPFKHFYCPLMMSDEPAELCLGHTVPQSLVDAPRATVPQRKDIDAFYGTAVEADLSALFDAVGKPLDEIMADPTLSRAIRPQLIVEDEPVKHYPFRGHRDPSHTRLNLEIDHSGRQFEFVLAMTEEEAVQMQAKSWGIGVEFDARLPLIATMLKAAYLTLFRIHGYHWGLSAGGVEIGYQLLGGCFREYKRRPAEAKTALKKWFSPYRHAVRPLGGDCEQMPRGTVENNRSAVCFGSSGKPFAQVVFIRGGGRCHGVLLPGYENPDSAAAYYDFLNNDNETLRISPAWFDADELLWKISPNQIETHWPKRDESFEFE